MNDYHSAVIRSPRIGYHVTTPKKLARYNASGRIIAPVRFWPNAETALQWAKKTARPLILRIVLPTISYPLPDHKPALFCAHDVTEYDVVYSAKYPNSRCVSYAAGQQPQTERVMSMDKWQY